ncbi:FtsH protease activity modulator HflK [bacterium]|nr:FtsH protease activity modulator HflK [bacterium]
MKIPYRHINIGGDVFRVPDLGKMFGRFSGVGLIAVVILLWLLSGIYVVGPDEEGVIRTFGKFTRIHTSGLNYHMPWPIETVNLPKVTEVKRLEVGFREDRRANRVIDIPEESLMLSGSLNIVAIDLIVQYKIKDPVKYLFVVRDVPTTIQLATEAVIRQVVGQHSIDEALTTGKGTIQAETMQMLQAILDNYECGVTITQVQLKDVLPPDEVADAFREVASAKEDKARLVNEAQGYANDLIPKARGEAAQQVLQAQGFAEERVKRAEGEAKNFEAVLAAYRKAPTVTRKRMLLETMEEVLPGVTKYILKTQAGGDLVNVVGSGLGAAGKQAGSTKGGGK